MSLISATVWNRSEYESCLVAGETRVFGTLAAAEAWAAMQLPTTVTTNDCYWRDCGRAGHVEFTRLGKPRPYAASKGRCPARPMTPAGHYTAPVEIVPSCGDLGYF